MELFLLKHIIWCIVMCQLQNNGRHKVFRKVYDGILHIDMAV